MRLRTNWIHFLTGLFMLGALSPALADTGADAPSEGEMTNLLFIHHSCGGQLLADPGAQDGGTRGSGERCIYGAHPNGGGLRTRLQDAGYRVNELSYESRLGEDTDIHHWREKFTAHMADLLRVQQQDGMLPEGQTNEIVVFKSCYPNNDYVGPGETPGDPDSPERTVANSQAAYNSLLPLFAAHPEVLFIALTPPPRAEPKPQGVKETFTGLFKSKPKDADYARQVNTWLADTGAGWLKDYPLPNVAVFDYYDILTDGGASNWSRYPTGGGRDSHPSPEGNAKAAQVFVPFLAEARLAKDGKLK